MNTTFNIELPHDLATGFRDFFHGYLETMFWSSTQDSGDPLERDFGFPDLAPEAHARAFADCLSFWLTHSPWITYETRIGSTYGHTVDALAGHDFWLTRNGHGAGFWDGDWADYPAERMDKASEAFAQQYAYVGDDGKVYLS